MVVVVAFILEHGSVGEHGETVGEATGMKNWRWLCSVRRHDTCLPYVGEPLRMSAATSSTDPRTHLTSLARE